MLISHGASCDFFFSKFIVNSFSELDKMDEQELKPEHLCSPLLRTSLRQRSCILLKSSYSSSKCVGGFNAPLFLIVLDLMPPPPPQVKFASILSDLFILITRLG